MKAAALSPIINAAGRMLEEDNLENLAGTPIALIRPAMMTLMARRLARS